MKRKWSEARDEFEDNTGLAIDKTNFLAIYAEAHIKTLMKENILAAFRKTGVVPFNPNVITDEMMAPSLTSSIQATLPLPLEGPTLIITDMIHGLIARQVNADDTPASASETVTRSKTVACPPTPVRRAVNSLRDSSYSFLVTPTTPKS